MSDPAERKALAVELFNVTGEAVPENDPIVTGALFFSYKLAESGRLAEQAFRDAAALAVKEIRDAGRQAAQDVLEAGRKATLESGDAATAAGAATRAATAALVKMSADRSQLLKAVETQMTKCVRQAGKVQSAVQDFRHIPIWYAVVGAVAGAVALSAALMVGVERSSALAEDAAVGRAFARALPTMDPKLKQQLMEHLRRPAH